MELSAYFPLSLLENKEFSKETIESLDSIYLGEVYCAKRGNLSLSRKLAEKIKGLEKKVYFSTLVMPTNENSLKYIRRYFRLAEEGIFDALCVNDSGALEIGLKEFPQVKIFAGPYLDIRNPSTAKVYADLGVKRIVLPYDLPFSEIAEISKSVAVEIEILGQGQIPILVSRRCFLMRAKGLKENEPCNFLCKKEYPQGMLISPLDKEKEPLMILGGKVIYSYKNYSLLENLAEVITCGIKSIRIEEWQSFHPEIYQIYRTLLNDGLDKLPENFVRLSEFSPQGLCNGWFFAQEGYRYVAEPLQCHCEA